MGMILTYLFDPLCGWCYGAHPMIEKIVQQPGVALTLAPVGLFAGEKARPMDAAFAGFAWQNDQRIAELTGQVFSQRYRNTVLSMTGTMFDSQAATLGLVAAASQAPLYQLAILKAIHHARYIDGRQTCDRDVIADILDENDLPSAAEQVRECSPQLVALSQQRIEVGRAEMARFAVRGVPTLIAGNGKTRQILPNELLFNPASDPSAIFNLAP
jgi:putative protein-disulfide isomerase